MRTSTSSSPPSTPCSAEDARSTHPRRPDARAELSPATYGFLIHYLPGGFPAGSSMGLIAALEWMGMPHRLCRVDMFGEMREPSRSRRSRAVAEALRAPAEARRGSGRPLRAGGRNGRDPGGKRRLQRTHSSRRGHRTLRRLRGGPGGYSSSKVCDTNFKVRQFSVTVRTVCSLAPFREARIEEPERNRRSGGITASSGSGSLKRWIMA